jgi:RNA polymerase sigma-70 factor, ECF subfamily
VLKLLRDDAAAQDVVQQTFIVVIEKIGSLRLDVTFRQWLFTIARNESLMVLRRRRLVPMDALEEAGHSVFDADTPETVFEKQETIGLVHEAVDRLTPMYREIILLRVTEQLSYEEIAAITETTVSAVKSKLHKARIALAIQLSDTIKKEDRQ